ncbi:MAG: hypothetical protein HDR25_05660 [Lachnospiraceae bacterium]|nr:hypothetical protein [Lachnospiraceae bacterium]
MATVKELLTMMQLSDFTHVVVLSSDRHYYLGGGFQPDVLRRFGKMRVCSTDILEGKFMIFVKQ